MTTRTVLVLLAVLALAGCCRGEVDPDSGQRRRALGCELGEALGEVFFRVTLGLMDAAIRSAWR